MKIKQVVFLSLFLNVTVILALSHVTPPIDDYILDNPLWNGFSDVERSLRPISLISLETLSDEALNVSRSVLLIVGPSTHFLDNETDAIERYMMQGGTVILADDFGSGNELLSKIGLTARFSGFMIRDLLFMERASGLPRIIDLEYLSPAGEVSSLTFNYATSLSEVDSAFKVLASSSAFSYLDVNDNCQPDVDEEMGPFPVIAELRYGGGALVLVTDSSAFLNSMLHFQDNNDLLMYLTENKTLYIDRLHWRPRAFTLFKWTLMSTYTFISSGEIKYTLLMFMMILISRFRWSGESEEIDELKMVIVRHPDWNRNTLHKLKEWRDNVGNK